MASFQFQNYIRELDFEGVKLPLDCDTSTGEVIRRSGDQLRTLSRDIASGAVSNADAVRQVGEIIDEILGPGAVKKIFQGRKPTINHCADIIVYIVNEYNAAQKEIRDKLTLK